jgi:hypothetical protein
MAIKFQKNKLSYAHSALRLHNWCTIKIHSHIEMRGNVKT